MNRIAVVATCLVTTVLTVMSCKHEILNDPSSGIPVGDSSSPPVSFPVSGIPCSQDSVYYLNTIEPLVISSCASVGCHDASSHKEGLNLTSYNNIRKIVVPGKASESKLYKVLLEKGEDRMPPDPMSPLSATQVNAIKTWINQGARNNHCDACDSTNSSYSKGILPIIQNKCSGCHNSTNAGGGIDLSSYQKTFSVAISGKLLGSIKWNNGFIKMPQGGTQLPACEIKQIETWINNGAKND